jgi:DNA modification methylase
MHSLIIGPVEVRMLSQLLNHRSNARMHSDWQIDRIAASIVEFGFVNPVLITPDSTIIAGHARVRAARKMGLTEVPVIVLAHLSEAQQRALLIADNQLALDSSWDEEKLRKELADLQQQDFDLELLGFDDKLLTQLMTDERIGSLDVDIVPRRPRIATSVPGDLWVLGEHRLLCGDALDGEALSSLMRGEMAQMVFTDPPYNVAYTGKTAERLSLVNDELGDQFEQFLFRAFTNMFAACQGAMYVCMSSSELHRLYKAFTDAGGHWSTYVIWAKHHFTLGRSDYQRQYEPILYGWPKGTQRHWCGDRKQGDVWFIPRPAANREHPTMKPVELVERAIENSTKGGDLILDPFAGSGTTLIACHRRKRRARVIEIDPVYVDVICRRWEQFTGKSAVLDADGRSFEEVLDLRRQKVA